MVQEAITEMITTTTSNGEDSNKGPMTTTARTSPQMCEKSNTVSRTKSLTVLEIIKGPRHYYKGKNQRPKQPKKHKKIEKKKRGGKDLQRKRSQLRQEDEEMMQNYFLDID
ncbi:hypothetical protein CHS0354_011134 [Potamilus streckersoni]|uniref:Uncharacterized protein n=1 Tax=Potamilus streckersoni TaxID=2493646 RepID=A0AAE0W3G1_9BIVA|nr:hypothetical protein CHS0354_011134 [Potamilus streckersoni]